jgi:hypothetical protein
MITTTRTKRHGRTVLLVGVSEADTATIAGRLDGMYVASVRALWEAGATFVAIRPDVVVVDPSMGAIGIRAIARELDARPDLGKPEMIWIEGGDLNAVDVATAILAKGGRS